MKPTIIFTKKTVLMQRLIDAVGNGYHWYTCGVIDKGRSQCLVQKFAEKYGTSLNKNQRAYRRRKGVAVARLFMLDQPNEEKLKWWLLVTDGGGAVHHEEMLNDAYLKRSRIRMGEDYELVRITKSGNPVGCTVLTWRMTRKREQEWREWLIEACRKSTEREICKALDSLYKSPGFSGIRKQVGKLVTMAKKEWRRRHGEERLPGPERQLGYVQRLSNEAGVSFGEE